MWKPLRRTQEEGEWKMSQASGILIMFGGIFIVLLLMLLLRAKLNSKRAKKKPALFEVMHRAVEEAVPQAKGYPVVMAQAEKDTMSLLKEAGGDFARQFAVAAVGAVFGVRANLHTYGSHPPKFVLAYRGDEIFAVCVGNPSYNTIEADTECILHLTRQTVEKVKLKASGRTTFYLQGGTQFIVSLPLAAASEIEQKEEVDNFKKFLTEFAQVVNEQ